MAFASPVFSFSAGQLSLVLQTVILLPSQRVPIALVWSPSSKAVAKFGMFLYVVKAPLPVAFQVPLCSGSEKCQLQALFFLFLGHPPLDFWRKIGRDATVLKFSFSLAKSAHKVFVYIPLWRKIWVCLVWIWSFYHACKVFEVIPSSFVSLNPLLCSSIVSCPSIHLLCGL